VKLASFTDDATRELVLAAAWYEEKQEDLADSFVEQIKRAMGKITEWPARFPRMHLPSTKLVIRRALVEKFPYALVYVELSEEVRVIAVAHCKREPFYWLSRLN
jgi:toxin ParE1/3/4